MKHINPAEVYASNEVTNNAGGISFSVDNWNKLDRFLILGAEAGTYYASPRKNAEHSTKSVSACIKEDGIRVVKRVVEVSDQGLAPKNDQAIFVLALALKEGNPETKSFAKSVINKVVRTASHLTQFVEYSSKLRGWGRALRTGVSNWYSEIGRKDPSDNEGNLSALVYQLMKYANRNGFTQRDILRLCHVHPTNELQSTLFNWICHPDNMPSLPSYDNRDKLIAISEELYKYAAAKQLDKHDENSVIELVTKYRLPHEVIPTSMRNSSKVWQALLDAGMPLNALIRNLGKLSQLGLTDQFSENTNKICDTFRNEEYIRKSRIHPINVLNQKKGYEIGCSMGGLEWKVNPKIVEALEDMFYLSFGNVESTGKNIVLALDVSGSMTVSGITGMNLRAHEVTAAMAMATLRAERNCMITAFSDDYIELPINSRMSLNEVLRVTSDCSFGGTDCALPMIEARNQRRNVDSFVIYTDNETWAGGRYTPAKALKEYKEKMDKPDSKMIVVATSCSDFTIADPNDPLHQLDIAGFSSAVPGIISWFIGK